MCRFAQGPLLRSPCVLPSWGAEADVEGLNHSMATEGGGSRQMKDGHWEPEEEGRLNPFISPPLFFLFPISLSSSSFSSFRSSLPRLLFPSLSSSSLWFPSPFLFFSLFPSSSLLPSSPAHSPSLPLSLLMFSSLSSSLFILSSSFLFLRPLLRLSSCLILDCAVQTEPVVTCVYVLNPNAASRSHTRFLSAFDQKSL